MSDFAVLLMIYFLLLPVLPIVYGLMRGLAKPKKNIMLGVTLPAHAQADPRVSEIAAAYKRGLLYAAILGLLLSACCFLMASFGAALAWQMNWIILVLVLLYIPYVRAYRKLKALKNEEGWQGAFQTVVDVQAAVQGVAPMRRIHFLPPCLVSLVPMVLALLEKPAAWEEALLYGTFVLLTLLFYGVLQLYTRTRAEVVSSDTSLNAMLQRARYRQITKLCLYGTWCMAALGLCLFIFQKNTFLLMLSICIITCILLLVAVLGEWKTRKIQQAANTDGGEYVDEDRFWIGGQLYYNPNDRHLLVKDRVGMGTSVNFARPGGMCIGVLSLLCILALPFLGIWLVQMENTPVSIVLTEDTVQARHIGLEYEVAFSDITEVSLLETLPNLRRIAGNSLSTLRTGRYEVEGYGTCRICLDKEIPPYLLLRAGDTMYLFGGSDATQVQAAYQAILGAANAYTIHNE